MSSIEHQIFQLQRELDRQEIERKKMMAETRALTRETLQEVAELRAQREKQLEIPQQSTPPGVEGAATSKGGRFFQNGDRLPDNQELKNIWGTAEESEIFTELQDWIDSDRAASEAEKKSRIRPDAKRWFNDDQPVPTMAEMMENGGANLQAMMRELDSQS